jgi:hypothetical protein
MTDHKLDFRLSAQDRRGPIFVRSEGPAAGQRPAMFTSARRGGRPAADGRARRLVPNARRSIRGWRVDRYAIGAAG